MRDAFQRLFRIGIKVGEHLAGKARRTRFGVLAGLLVVLGPVQGGVADLLAGVAYRIVGFFLGKHVGHLPNNLTNALPSTCRSV